MFKLARALLIVKYSALRREPIIYLLLGLFRAV